jgi:hypothetical protein
MGQNGLTVNAIFPVTPPTIEFPFNLHRLVQEQSFETEAHSHCSSIMEHEAYHNNQYGSSYPDPHDPVGLGIQYVRRAFNRQIVLAPFADQK